MIRHRITDVPRRALCGMRLGLMLGVTVLALCACNKIALQGSQADILRDLIKSKTGIAVLMMDMAKKPCPLAQVVLGRKIVDGYVEVKRFQLVGGEPNKSSIAQLQLAPGSYHIVHWTCAAGRYVQEIGVKNNSLFAFGTTYARSYAVFTIASGEVVNLGFLRITDLSDHGVVQFDVSDMPPAAHVQLRKEQPGLYKQMTKRAMQLNQDPMTDKQRKAYCKLQHALAQGKNKPDQTSASCLAP